MLYAKLATVSAEKFPANFGLTRCCMSRHVRAGLACKANAQIPAAMGALADVPVCEDVHSRSGRRSPSWDRYYKNKFPPETFLIKFHPQIYSENNRYKFTLVYFTAIW
jgi:hypothetical protein